MAKISGISKFVPFTDVSNTQFEAKHAHLIK